MRALYLVQLASLFLFNLIECQQFSGGLSQNTLLQNATYFAKGKIRGPESIVFDKHGNLYTSLIGGLIVKVDKDNRELVSVVAWTGEETNATICSPANGNTNNNPKCGRPLGLRINRNQELLYVIDSFYGIFRIDLKTGSKTTILSSNDDQFGSSKPKLLNDFDMDGDVIYFVDSSYLRNSLEALQEIPEQFTTPRGRLFKYTQSTKRLELLLSNLFFPNGISLTPQKDVLLISEMTRTRITKYNISSKTVEVFAQLAGGSDNVRISDQGTLFVPFALVNGYFENNKPYGLAAEYDLNGTVIRSWHDPNGTKIDQTTHIELYGNKLYFGSFSGDGMAVLDMANGAGEDGSLRGCKWILEFLMKLVKMVKNVWYYY